MLSERVSLSGFAGAFQAGLMFTQNLDVLVAYLLRWGALLVKRERVSRDTIASRAVTHFGLIESS